MLVIAAIMIGSYLLILASHALLEIGRGLVEAATTALLSHGVCLGKACGA